MNLLNCASWEDAFTRNLNKRRLFHAVLELANTKLMLSYWATAKKLGTFRLVRPLGESHSLVRIYWCLPLLSCNPAAATQKTRRDARRWSLLNRAPRIAYEKLRWVWRGFNHNLRPNTLGYSKLMFTVMIGIQSKLILAYFDDITTATNPNIFKRVSLYIWYSNCVMVWVQPWHRSSILKKERQCKFRTTICAWNNFF